MLQNSFKDSHPCRCWILVAPFLLMLSFLFFLPIVCSALHFIFPSKYHPAKQTCLKFLFLQLLSDDMDYIVLLPFMWALFPRILPSVAYSADLSFFPIYCLAGCWLCCHCNGYLNGQTAVGKHFREIELIGIETMPPRKWHGLLPQRTSLAFPCLFR